MFCVLYKKYCMELQFSVVEVLVPVHRVAQEHERGLESWFFCVGVQSTTVTSLLPVVLVRSIVYTSSLVPANGVHHHLWFVHHNFVRNRTHDVCSMFPHEELRKLPAAFWSIDGAAATRNEETYGVLKATAEQPTPGVWENNDMTAPFRDDY